MRLSPKQADLLAAICKIQSVQREDVTISKLEKELGLNKDYIARIISGLSERDKILRKAKIDRKTVYSLNPDNIVTSLTVAKILIELGKFTPCDYIIRNIFEENLVTMSFMKERENSYGESDNDYIKRILDWCIKPEVNYIRSFPGDSNFISVSDRFTEEKGYLERIAGIKPFP